MKIFFLFKGFCIKSYFYLGNDRIVCKNECFNVKNLSEFFDIEEVKEIVKSIYDYIDEFDKELIKFFFSECNLFELDFSIFDRY